ncbi:type II secretion system protein GspM [Methylomonas sp. HYX-M1]|uniref:type II secretion system protein GspM n=1 Tax=Methylomonas sp. HYX-M1 TaxID=3139307 RepID=UPI00345B9BB1
MRFISPAVADRWQALSARERGLCVAGAAAVLIVLGYFWLYSPQVARNAVLYAQIQAQRDVLQHLSKVAARVKPLRDAAGEAVAVSADIRQTLADSSRQMQVADAIAEQQLGDGGDVDVRLQPLTFDRLAAWLAVLHQHGITVGEAELTSAGDGLVSGKLRLGAFDSQR